jgi:hypothetical protein
MGRTNAVAARLADEDVSQVDLLRPLDHTPAAEGSQTQRRVDLDEHVVTAEECSALRIEMFDAGV